MLIVGILAFLFGAIFMLVVMSVCGSDNYNKAFGDGFKAGTRCIYRHLRWEIHAAIEQGVQRDREWLQWGQEE